MEPGETPEEALVREIREELSADIQVGKLLYTVEWDYPQFHLTMHLPADEMLLPLIGKEMNQSYKSIDNQ